MMCCVMFVFFFFKQKTAYEMRISDWSSDVCSSDLSRVVIGRRSTLAGRSKTSQRLPLRWNAAAATGRDHGKFSSGPVRLESTDGTSGGPLTGPVGGAGMKVPSGAV